MNLVRRFSSAAVKFPDNYLHIGSWTPRKLWDYHAYSEECFYASTDATHYAPTEESHYAYLLWSPKGQLVKTEVGKARNVPGPWHAEANGAVFCLKDLKNYDETILNNLMFISDNKTLVEDVTQKKIEDIKPEKHVLVTAIRNLLGDKSKMVWFRRQYIESTDNLAKASREKSATGFIVAFHQILLEKRLRRKQCRMAAGRVLTPPPFNYKEQLLTQQKRLIDLSKNAFADIPFYEADLVYEINKRFVNLSLIKSEEDFMDCMEDSEEAIQFLSKYFLDTRPSILHRNCPYKIT